MRISDSEAGDEEPTVYAVRVAGCAREALLLERQRRAETVGLARADDWYDDMLMVLRGLATFPQRCAIAPEDDLVPGVAVRQLLHPTRHGPAWRILFTVHAADENDPPRVQVHHVRHSAQARLSLWSSGEDEL